MEEHKTPMSEEMLAKVIEKENTVAQRIIGDEENLNKLLQKLEQNLDSVPLVGPIAAEVPTLIAMVKAYSKGEYTEPPIGTIVTIVAAIVYCVAPDPIPGFADDAALLAFAVKKADDDLDAFREWQKKNGLR